MPDELEFTFSAINWRQMDRHPIDTTLVDDILYKLGRQRTNFERNGLIEVLENKDNKREDSNPYYKFIEKFFVNYHFSGKTLAWIALAYSIVLFLLMSILSRNYIQAHNSTIENIIIPSILFFLISTIVGLIRPASMALGNRKDVLKFYLSSAVISFASLFFVVESNNAHQSSTNKTKQTDSISRNSNLCTRLCVTRTNRPFVWSQFIALEERGEGLLHSVDKH